MRGSVNLPIVMCSAALVAAAAELPAQDVRTERAQKTVILPIGVVEELRTAGAAELPGALITLRLAENVRTVAGVPPAGERLVVIDDEIVGLASDPEVMARVSLTESELIRNLAVGTEAGAKFGYELLLVRSRREPAPRPEIFIRGVPSVSGRNLPLIYVDGVRMPSEPSDPSREGERESFLGTIDPQDIDRIEIIKGPAAVARYGERGANGVIQIFTKRGGRGGRT